VPLLEAGAPQTSQSRTPRAVAAAPGLQPMQTNHRSSHFFGAVMLPQQPTLAALELLLTTPQHASWGSFAASGIAAVELCFKQLLPVSKCT